MDVSRAMIEFDHWFMSSLVAVVAGTTQANTATKSSVIVSSAGEYTKLNLHCHCLCHWCVEEVGQLVWLSPWHCYADSAIWVVRYVRIRFIWYFAVDKLHSNRSFFLISAVVYSVLQSEECLFTYNCTDYYPLISG